MRHNYYKNDPFWMTSKYGGNCRKCGVTVKKGDEIWYYPKDKKAFCEKCGKAEESSFLSAVQDEEFYNRQYSSVLKKVAANIRKIACKEKTASEVAKTILQQLGGRRFIMMTGAKDLLGSSNSLSFKIGRNSASINGVRIVLTPMDTYTVSFLRKNKSEYKVVSKFDDVYADQLQELFTKETGMYTHL